VETVFITMGRTKPGPQRESISARNRSISMQLARQGLGLAARPAFSVPPGDPCLTRFLEDNPATARAAGGKHEIKAKNGWTCWKGLGPLSLTTTTLDLWRAAAQCGNDSSDGSGRSAPTDNAPAPLAAPARRRAPSSILPSSPLDPAPPPPPLPPWLLVLEDDALLPPPAPGKPRLVPLLRFTVERHFPNASVVWLDSRSGLGVGAVPGVCCTAAMLYRRSFLPELTAHLDFDASGSNKVSEEFELLGMGAHNPPILHRRPGSNNNVIAVNQG
jgi:hypothetical protein